MEVALDESPMMVDPEVIGQKVAYSSKEHVVCFPGE